MNEDSSYARNKGLSVGETAPPFSTRDVYGNKINLDEILRTHNGLLIDFFRGAW
jgi:peroxiredoxin